MLEFSTGILGYLKLADLQYNRAQHYNDDEFACEYIMPMYDYESVEDIQKKL